MNLIPLKCIFTSSFVSVTLEEFVAHAGPVNALRLGRKSGRVMVTGGDDRRVNVWTIGREGAIMVRVCSFFMPNTFLLYPQKSDTTIVKK